MRKNQKFCAVAVLAVTVAEKQYDAENTNGYL